MATERDLIKAVRESLEADGQLGRLKAEMRTEVMRILGSTSKSSKVRKTDSPRNVLIMNELVREYLDWIGYKYTSSVLIAECQLSKKPLDKSFLLQDLGIKDTENTRETPLLFNIIETFRNRDDSTADLNLRAN